MYCGPEIVQDHPRGEAVLMGSRNLAKVVAFTVARGCPSGDMFPLIPGAG